MKTFTKSSQLLKAQLFLYILVSFFITSSCNDSNEAYFIGPFLSETENELILGETGEEFIFKKSDILNRKIGVDNDLFENAGSLTQIELKPSAKFMFDNESYDVIESKSSEARCRCKVRCGGGNCCARKVGKYYYKRYCSRSACHNTTKKC